MLSENMECNDFLSQFDTAPDSYGSSFAELDQPTTKEEIISAVYE
jgi:hypothetical protein